MDRGVFIYTGNSMFPTFKFKDILYLDRECKISVGDVIVFSTDTKQKIVHRVIKIYKDKLLTQGDNNLFPDKFVLSRQNILGKVIYFKRKNKQLKVYNGKLGLIYFYILQLRKRFLNLIFWYKHKFIKIFKMISKNK